MPADRPFRPEQVPARPWGASTFPWEKIALQLGRRWWQRHPANAAAQLARPALARFAAAHPATLIAGAATVGAVAVLVKPWRFLSVAALAAALFKSSDVAEWVTLLATSDTTNNKDATSTSRKNRR